MERKPVNKKKIEALAKKVSSDDEQHLWETKQLGTEKKHAKVGSFYKSPAKLISTPEAASGEYSPTLISV